MIEAYLEPAEVADPLLGTDNIFHDIPSDKHDMCFNRSCLIENRYSEIPSIITILRGFGFRTFGDE